MFNRRVSSYLVLVFLAVTLIWVLAGSKLSSQAVPPQETVISGRNVNMVSGDVLPGGDPWLQRQNEPSIAVSSRNPLHLLAGANDYRTVDMPTSEGELPGKQPTAAVGDAWLGVFMSYDGGESWTSTMLPGFPQDPLLGNPLKAYRAAADPVVRSGPNGLFYFSGIAFNRDTNIGVVFVARFIDDNNKEGGGTIRYIDTKIIAKGTATKFLDKPWISVDQPRLPAGNITISGQTFPRHNVYLAYSAFTGTTSTVGDIMFSRSADCGTTWGTPIKISSGSYAHQGATIAIKPVIGEVLVAWRRFGVSGSTPDSIFVAQSLSRGLYFQSPVKVADVAPFDQPTTDETQALPGTGAGFAFRTNSYPTMTVDKSGHVYLAWAQRGVGIGGGARVVLSSSYFGSNWSVPQAVANLDENGLPFLGHQLMPSLSFAAGKLILVWYDQRHDVSSVQYGFNSWILDDLPFRHTMDVWAAEANTSTFPTLSWKSSQVSRYLHAMLQDGNGDLIYTSDGDPIVFPVQFNCVNYPLFKGGHNPFNGDYIDVAAAPTFKQDTWRNWIFNTDGPEQPVFHVAWTDNRDVRPPSNNNWTLYTPPVSTQDSAYISPERPGCNPYGSGNEPGMRNQNIYTSRVTWGIEAGSPVNDKPLNLPGGTARAFVVFVKNNTELLRGYRLTIAAQPVGGQASFEQFSLLATLDVEIGAYSTMSRPLFIRSSDINAAVTVNINEIDASGAVIANGLSSSILINGDTSNPQMSGNEETHNPNIVNSANPNIVNWYINPNIVNPNIRNPNIRNPNIVNPNIVNPNIRNPNIVNPNIVNPNIVNPNIVNRDVANPNIVNPNIVNPNIVNPNIRNATPEDVTATDVEWTVKNEGTTTTSYTLKTLAKMAPPEGVYVQLLVYRVHYTPAVAGAELKAAGADACALKQEPHHELILSVVNPNIVNPNIVNPNIVNPNIRNASIENATFSVAPGEEVIVDLRVLDSGVSEVQSQPQMAMSGMPVNASSQAFSVQDFIQSLGFAVTSQAVNSVDAAQGVQVPPADATDLVIGTSSLPDGVAGYSYNATLNAYGGTGSYSWSLNAGELPAGLVLGGTGLISGVPIMAGTYRFIARVDAGGQFDTQQYSIVIDSDTVPDTLSVVTTALPNGVQGHWYGATLEAVGGVYPRSWSLASGTLPDGLSLDSGGVVSGTPTTEGTSIFSVRVADRNGTIAVRLLSIDIAAETSVYFGITGIVYDETTGLPLAGVVLRGLPNTPVTGADGTYADQVPAGWTGTAIPFMAGHTFSPESLPYTTVGSPQTGQDYNLGFAAPTISGTVTLVGGTPLAGVVMTGLTGNPATDLAGYYAATVTRPWTGTVTPALLGYTFIPSSQTYTNITMAQITNYIATPVGPLANKLAFTQNPSGGIGGSSWAAQPKVEIQDADGNRIHGDNLTIITLTLSSNPGNGMLSGVVELPVVDGEAAFAGLSIDRGGQGYILLASTVPPITLAPATSAAFNIEGFSDRASMSTGRQFHTATFLETDKILVAGGMNSLGYLRSAELYDPAEDTFTPLGEMNDFRGEHTATPLLDGKILIAGGGNLASTAELFDPAEETFSWTGNMTYNRDKHAAARLQDGRVLITGGSPHFADTAEIYDPITGTFSVTGSLDAERSLHAATWLPNGKVLITGGGAWGGGSYLASAELFDPATGIFTSIGDMAGGARAGHTATLLNDGTVLITGGANATSDLETAEIFSPASNTFANIGSMRGAHSRHNAILLRDGTVLIVGGGDPEIYDPLTQTFHLTGPSYLASSSGNAAATTKDGWVFVTGGEGEGARSDTEMWNPFVPFPTHVISGHVTHLGAAVPGVLMDGFPGYPVTDYGGYYEAVVMDGWTGSVTPTKAGYSFTPAFRDYPTAVATDLEDQDFAAAIITHTISGTVKLGGAPLMGVVMNGLPGTPVTDAAGFYTATVNHGWSGAVMPALSGYDIIPGEVAYGIVNSDQSTDYVAVVHAYKITAMADPGGAIDPLGDVFVNSGADQAFTIMADVGHVISDVRADGISVGAVPSYTFYNVTADHLIRAYFAVAKYTLNVTTVNGTVNKAPDLPEYSQGTTVQLTATPAEGYHFVEWSGDATGEENPITITMDSNKSIIANFALTTYTISGTVTVGGVPLENVVMNGLPGSVVTNASGAYTATVGEFWSETVTPSLAGYTFVPANKVYTEVSFNETQNYAAARYQVTISGGISADSVPLAGVELQISTGGSATTGSDGRYSFIQWSGWSGALTPVKAGHVFAPPSQSYTNVIADQAGQDYSASLITFTLEYLAGAHGSISGITPQTVAYGGSGTQVIAVPDEGYHNSGWSDHPSWPAARTDTNVVSNISVTANFAINSYALTMSKTGTGTGLVASNPDGIYCGATCSAWFEHGTVVTLTATPIIGSGFTSWSGADVPPGQETANPLTITMSASKSLTANFTAYAPVQITTTSIPSGARLKNNASVPYTTTLTATGGLAPLTWSVASGALPAGMTLASDTGILSGTPTEAGAFAITAQVRDSVLQTATQQLTFVIADWIGAFHNNINDKAYAITADAAGYIYPTGTGHYNSSPSYMTFKYAASGALLYEAFYNGPSGTDEAYAVAQDALGNSYVTGKGPGTGTGDDIATVKYNSAGVEQWVRRYDSGAGNFDAGFAIAVDASGNVYVAAVTNDVYGSVIKYDSQGTQLWIQSWLHGNGQTWSFKKSGDIAVDSDGNVIVATSYKYGADDSRWNVIKYDTSGNFLWEKFYEPLSSVESSMARAVVFDAAGNAYVTGSRYTSSVKGVQMTTIKYNPSGVESWIKAIDTSYGYAIDLDINGNVYSAGQIYHSSNFDFGLVKYDAAGNEQWTRTYNSGGTAVDLAVAIAVDALGNAYLTGQGAYGTVDYTTAKWNAFGVLQWTAKYNGSGNSTDYATDLTLDPTGNLYVTGYSNEGTGRGYDFTTIKYSQSFPTTLMITTPWLDNGSAGISYAKALWPFGGSGTRTWSLIGGSLPSGLALGASTGVIAGMPSTPGIYGFTVQVDDGGLTATKAYTLTISPGAATKIQVETAADGLGTIVPAQNVSSGSSITVYAIARDASDTFIGNVAADSWSLENLSGGVVSGDLMHSEDLKSALFIGGLIGSANIRATKSGWASTDSGLISVVAAAATKIQVETAADGSGVVVPAQNISFGASIVVYAIARDATGNFIENIGADSWSLVNKTGGVTDGDLVAVLGNKSAIFTGNLIGSAQIHAAKAGLTSVDSGVLAVIVTGASRIDLTGPAMAGTGFLSEAFTITSQDAFGIPANVTQNTTFSLTSNTAGSRWPFFSDPAGTVETGSATILSGQNTATFYYKDSMGGTPTVTATRMSGANLGSDTHQIGSWPVTQQIAFTSDRDGVTAIYSMQVDGSGVTRLTDNSGAGTYQSWSPSGNKIAFCSMRDGNWNIYVMNADGSWLTRLTNDPSDDQQPRWSPDGTKIVFSSRGFGSGSFDIYVMNADGSNVTRLTSDPAWEDYPCWSPDGSKIVFGSGTGGNYDVYVMNADGSNVTRLTTDPATDSTPCWSPDGTKIAFVSNRSGNHDVHVMNADGTNQTRLTFSPTMNLNPCWSPDGGHIAFTSNRDGNAELYVMNADGTDQARLTTNAAGDYYASWGASKIWFSNSKYYADGKIHFMNADGTGLTRLPGSSTNDHKPKLSPDGKKVVFVNRSLTGQDAIYCMNIDGTGMTYLTDSTHGDHDPSWSPDGTKIVFSSKRGTEVDFEIYVMNADGSSITQLTNGAYGYDQQEPTWSPDGSKIAYSSSFGSPQIYVIDPDGSGQTDLAAGEAPSWSPDGQKIAFRTTNPASGLYVMNGDGTNKIRLTSNTTDTDPCWSPNGKRIAFTRGLTAQEKTLVMNADGTNIIDINVEDSLFPSWGAQPRIPQVYEFVAKWGSSGTGDGFFNHPFGVATDSGGYIYVADTNNHRIQKFTSTGDFVRTWGTQGSDNGQFNYPYGIAVSSSAGVFVVDTLNHRIQRFTLDGEFVAAWGTQGNGNGQFQSPYGIAIAGGDVYVADTSNHRIQRFTLGGSFMTAWGTQGSGDGQLNSPWGIGIDSFGNVYVADTGNHRVQKFTSWGSYVDKWGSYGTGDGQFDMPAGLAIDGNGSVYVAEYSNSRIQKFTSNGVCLSRWGGLGGGDGKVNYPSGIAVDAAGYVYVADTNNFRIQKFRKR